MHVIRVKKYPKSLFTLKGPRDFRSVTIDLTTLTIGSSGIFSLTFLYRANLYISSFSLELTRILCKTWRSIMYTLNTYPEITVTRLD